MINIYYGGVIRSNVGSVDEMIQAIDAVFFHCSCTDGKPVHQFCSVGKDSWCKYQKVLANHHVH